MKKIAILLFVSIIFIGYLGKEQFSQLITLNTSSEDQSNISNGTNQENTPNKPKKIIELTDHNTYISFADELNFEKGERIAESASVPEAVVIDKNIYVYFVNALQAHKGDGQNIYYIMSEDGGETWTDREIAVINGLLEGAEPVDPSLVVLEDGRMRMYFYDFKQRRLGNKTWTIYSAISTDGKTFTVEAGTRLVTKENMTDPEVIFFDDAWFMYYAGGEERGICVASSKDGLTFKDYGPISETPFQGIPGAITKDGEVLVFGDDGLASSTNGLIFSIEKEKVMHGFDPSPIEYNGGYIMIYKDFSDE